MSKIALVGDVSGTGTLSIVAPNTSTDRTLTLPDNTGTIITTASTFAGTGPAFSATGSTFSITAGVWTKIQFQTEQFDTANCFDSTTNYRFTPNVAGYYLFTGTASQQDNSANTLMITEIYKNGSSYQQLGAGTGNISAYAMASGSIIISMNGSSDYVELYAFVFPNNTNIYLQRFTGTLVRAA